MDLWTPGLWVAGIALLGASWSAGRQFLAGFGQHLPPAPDRFRESE